MNNKTTNNPALNNKELKLYINDSTKALKKITNNMVSLYGKQCKLLNAQMQKLIKAEPNKIYESAYRKWQKEICTLEENYANVFDKWLEEKKEMDEVSRLNLY